MNAVLALEDGTVYRGMAAGAEGETSGEVVFNTSLTGYQEILTDPSYCRQIVTLTYPHIGNTGINAEDVESDKVYAAGLVIRDLPLAASNWRSKQDLPSYLRENNVVAIADMRVGQRDDLAAVRRIGEDLLVPGHRRIEDDLARGEAARADGAARKHRPVGKDEDGGIEHWHGKLPD